MENLKNSKVSTKKINVESLKNSIESKKADLKESKKSDERHEIYKKQFQSKKERGKIRSQLEKIINNLISKDRSIEDRINSIESFFNWSEKYLINPIKEDKESISKLKKSDFSLSTKEEKLKDIEKFLYHLKNAYK